MIRVRERAEPRPANELRRERVCRIDEQHSRVIRELSTLTEQQLPNLVLRIREHECRRGKPVAHAQIVGEALEQVTERRGLEQRHLAAMRPFPGVFVPTRLFR